MSARMDFFEVVKNLHPPNQAWKRYERNYSGTGSDNDSKNLYPPNQGRKRYDRNYSGTGSDNDNIPGMHVPSWTNHNNLPKEELPHPNSNSKSLKHPTTAAMVSPPPFPYNEVHPRTSAHLHKCPSCDYPVMVQVTADLFYHHVSFIPAAMAKRNNETYDVNNFVNESQHLSHGGRTQQYSPVLEPEEEGEEEEEEEEVSTLSNEQTEMMVTAPKEKPQQRFITYASITAGNNIVSKEDDNPLEETDYNPHLKVGLGQGEAQVIVIDKAKETITASEVENITSSQVDNGGDGDDDASNDGFTTVVSWKTKLRAKAAAKAKEAAAHGYGYGRGKNRFGRHGRGSTREEHNKNAMMALRDEQHDIKDGGPRGEDERRTRRGLIKDGHEKHGRRGPRDEHIKYGAGDQKEEWQDKHGRNEHNKHGTGDRDQKEDMQNRHVRAPWDKRDNYGEFPRERNENYRGYTREEHTPQRERGHAKKGK